MRRRFGMDTIEWSAAAAKCAGAASLLGATVLGIGVAAAPAARADAPATQAAEPGSASTVFPDIPANHWAYQAVEDLAAKGYVKGYPDGAFLGQRALTRYEFATVLDRMLQTIKDLDARVAAQAPPPPAAPAVTQDDLNKIQALVDEFKPEMAAIHADVDNAKKEIDALRGSVTALQAAVKKAQAEADSSYGYGLDRKFAIGGFVQFRYERVDSGDHSRFPDGVGMTNGYNGNYSSGTAGSSFKIREARIFVTGQLTQNSRYLVEFGAPGAVNTTSSGTAQVFIRRLYGQYTFGNGSAKYPTLTYGQFWLPFGYMINAARPTWYTPERPLAFNETPAGLFAGQEFDRGVQLRYAPTPGQGFSETVALVNGDGSNSNDTNRNVDVVARITYGPTKTVNFGASLYEGRFNTTASPEANAKKQLYGADFQYQPVHTGPFLQSEYVGGKYEAIPPASIGSPAATPPTGVPAASAYLPGNKISGWYAIGGWTFNPSSAHALSLVASYDVFDRSNIQKTRTDKNVGYGILYNLDRTTRVRLFYIKPTEVAYAPNTTAPPKVGQMTAEMQVRF